MGETRSIRRVAVAARGTRFFHIRRVPAKQRIHLSIVLISLLLSFPVLGQDISFDPDITQEEFHQFTSLIGQAIYASPVEPATSRGLLAFDVGIAGTAIPVDETASYWIRSVSSDIVTDGYVIFPRLVVSKGLGVANLSASLARVPDSDIDVWGAALDVPILSGNLALPTVSVRGTYAEVRGVEELDMKTYGAEVFISKGFGPFTPYAAAGISRTDAEGRIAATALTPAILLEDAFERERFTVGVRFSLLFPKIVIEATQAEELSYSAKLSLGL